MNSSSRTDILVAMALLAAVFVVASPGLENEFIFDDTSRITGNYDIRALSNLKTHLVYPYEKGPELYRNDPLRPFVYLSYTLNHAWGGVEPLGYHVVDLFLHGLTAVVLFVLLKTLALRSFAEPAARSFAALAALLFAIHPLNIAAALYSYSRSMTLFALFALLALLVHVRAREHAVARTLGVSFFFLLALASRQTAIVLPLVLLAFDLTLGFDAPSQGLREARRAWRHHACIFTLAAAYLVFHFAYFGALGDLAIGEGVRWERGAYLAHQPYALLRYIQLLVLPVGQSFQHAIAPDTLSAAVKWGSVLVWIALLIGGALLVARCREPLRRAIVFALVFFFAFLLPVSSFFPTAWVMDERRVYLSSAAFFALVAMAALALHRRSSRPGRVEVGFTIVLLACGLASIQQARLGRTAESQWSHVLALYPESPYALEHLALIHAARGQDKRAARYYAELFRHHPGHFKGLCEFAEFNLERGRLALARQSLDNAKKISPRHPLVRELEERIAEAESSRRSASPAGRESGR